MKRNAPAVLIPLADGVRGSIEGLEKPGHFRWTRGAGDVISGMLYGCPCGCGAVHGAFFAGRDRNDEQLRVTWAWDGNEEKPTLDPSLGLHKSHRNEIGPDGVYHWHGYLRAGVFEEC